MRGYACAGSQSDGQEAGRTQALRAAAQGLLSLQSRVGLPDAAALAIAVAQIGTVVMEQSPNEFAKGAPEVTLVAANGHTESFDAAYDVRVTYLCMSTVQAVSLAQLMAKCLARPEMAVAETVLEYFNALDYVLMADRDPVLRAPLYRDLLPSLLRHARYPEGFTTWDEHVEDDRDKDAFKRFRCTKQQMYKRGRRFSC